MSYKKILFVLVTSTSFFEIVQGQDRLLRLNEAITMAQQQSFEYKVALNRYQSNRWNYANYKASFLPTLSIDGTVPSYNRSINRITLPNGEDAFVSQNQAFSNLNLGVRQNISATGGTLSVGSSLNRIDVFGNLRQTNYSSVPVSVSYLQNTIGFNSFKWLKKTEPLRFESAKRELTTSMQQISLQTVGNYFNMIATQTQRTLSKQNLANADTLHRIAKDRFKIGTVSQSELLQLRLNVLNAQNRVREDSISYVLARQQFSRYLLIDGTSLRLEIPDQISFYEINVREAIAQAKNNSKAVMDFRLKRLEAERSVAQVKSESNLKFNVRANFGLSNTAADLQGLLNGLENQQNVSLSFSLPLLDWGFAKTQKLRSEANLSMVKSEIEQQDMQMEQEVSLHVSRWNLHQKNIAAAIEAKQIAEENYELEIQRYKLGRISINDLNAAQSQKDNSSNAYIQSIRTYWDLYYTIGKLTLYNFEKKEKIVFDVIK